MMRTRRHRAIEANGSSKSVAGVWESRMVKVGAAGTVAAAALLLAGCTSSTSSSPAPTTAKDVAAVNSVVHEQMTIKTGKMVNKPGWPEFVPSNLSFPAGSTVVLTIVNYDDGTAPLSASSPYGHVWGSDPTFGVVSGGTETVDGKSVTEIPNNEISHTFTIPGLLINVPIPAVQSGQKTTTVVYTFKVSKTGRFTWQCEAPCGTGSTGMGGAMNQDGWMQGVVNVT